MSNPQRINGVLVVAVVLLAIVAMVGWYVALDQMNRLVMNERDYRIVKAIHKRKSFCEQQVVETILLKNHYRPFAK